MISHHAQVVRVASPTDADVSAYVEGELVEYGADRLGIDDVRACTTMASRRPREGDTQTLVIRTGFITLESQHAMLKLLEEPPASTRLVILIPTDVVLLPTILSRVVEVRDMPADGLVNELFAAFLAASYKDRLQQIDVAAKKKDTAWQRTIKDGLIAYITSNAPANAQLEYVARWLLTRGASNKMLLEQAALSLPVTS